ncbi:glycosyltransferase family 1 protein [Facklamia sp. DSM 111018]|uniref:Glycosyltransferase family 1 protein n=1 Tax=Facklamia lactis TaxID=2749967 RepID=A0ABS0LQN7_9LACT|nr:glycosyltransferase family 1 protein [Facklamia lactis]MBG9980657.1 glycosyltransferase family 1 protein [Facklamia lactis]MBG9986471.1 glycosyltransferase family 1 protein [Facklamia lactis]
MRIAIVTETFLPSTDGIVTRITKAIEFMCRQGHQVLVIAPDIEGLPEYFEGAKVRGANTIKFFLYKQRPWAIPDSKVKVWLEEFQPDIVHAVNPASLTASAVYYANKLKIPLLCSFHTNLPDYADRYRVGFIKPILWRYIRKMHNKALVNLVTSQAMYDLLEAKDISNLQILPKGVDTINRHPRFHSEEMRHHLCQGNHNKKLLIYVGRLAPEKGIQRLRPLFDQRKDICLAIVGDGPARAELEEVFKNTPTFFTGFLHGKELSMAYASADAFVFPSTSETLGLVITESMASGTPVIAAYSPPTAEQIDHGESGLIYQEESMSTLHQAIDLLEDSQLVEKIRLNGREYAEAFSWDNASQAMLDAYTLAIERYKN